MPIYEYKCGSCQKLTEQMQSFSDPPLATCPECGKGPMEKLISLSGFALKGSGYYSTDYKKSSAASATPSGSGDTGSCNGGACGGGGCATN